MYEYVHGMVQEHGALFYLITFLWALVEGETFLIFAGFFVSQGFLNLPMLILCAGLGTTCGDFGCFWLGRRYGVQLVKKMPKLASGQAKVVGWLEKHDVGFILAYRFVYGLRNISAIAIGTSQISWQRYLALNFCGAFVWAVSFAVGGYLFGNLLVREGEDPVASLMKGVLGIIILVIVVRYVSQRIKIKQSNTNKKPPC
jgi:membrane protein DedA with SNARE-associated domain